MADGSMDHRSASWHAWLRGVFVALLAVLMVVSSLPEATRAAAGAALPAGPHAKAELPAGLGSSAKPCKRAVLPGAASNCSVSVSGVSVLPEAPCVGPRQVALVRWCMIDFSLAAQCQGASPYRPPCSQA